MHERGKRTNEFEAIGAWWYLKGRQIASMTMFSVSSHMSILAFSAPCDGRAVEGRAWRML